MRNNKELDKLCKESTVIGTLKRIKRTWARHLNENPAQRNLKNGSNKDR